MTTPTPVRPSKELITPIRLAVLEARMTTPATDLPGVKTDGFEFELRPVANAYWVLVPPTFEEQMVLDYDVTPISFIAAGRTNRAGQMVFRVDDPGNPGWVDVHDVDHPLCPWEVRTQAVDVVPHTALGESSRLFWTYDVEEFQRFRDMLWIPTPVLESGDAGPEPTRVDRLASWQRATEEFLLFELSPLPRSRPPTPPATTAQALAGPLLHSQPHHHNLPLLDEEEDLRVGELILADDERQRQWIQWHPTRHDEPAAWRFSGRVYDVTPPPLRRLFAAEWATRYAVHVRKHSVRRWATLRRAKELVHFYQSDAPIPEEHRDLERGVISPHASDARAPTMRLHVQPRSARRLRLVEELQQYALECARAGVAPDGFFKSVAMHVPAWRRAAEEIRAQVGVSHPLLSRDEQQMRELNLQPSATTALRRYFSVYAFAKEQLDAGYLDAFDFHEAGVGEAEGWVLRRLRSMLPERGCTLALHRALTLCTQIVPDGTADEDNPRLALARRWYDALARLGVPAWETLDEHDWARVRPWVKWVRKCASKGSSLFSALMAEHLSRYRFALSQVRNASALLNYHHQFDLAVDGVVVAAIDLRQQHIPQSRFTNGGSYRVDWDRSLLEIEEVSATGTARRTLPLRFARRVETVPFEQIQGDNTARAMYALLAETEVGQAQHLRNRVAHSDIEVVADPAFLSGSLCSARVKLIANALNALLVTEDLATAGEQAGVFPCVELASGLFVTLDSASGWLAAERLARGVTPEAHVALQDLRYGASAVERQGSALHVAGGLAKLLSSGMDFYKGVRVFTLQDSSAAEDLRAGGDRATMQVVRGSMLLATGTGAAAATTLELFGAATAITGPIGWSVLVLGIAVVGVELAITWVQATRSDFEIFEDAFRTALSEEFREDVGAESDMPGHEPRVRGRSACLTKAHLATLNAVLPR